MADFAGLETVLDDMHSALLAGKLAHLGDLAAMAEGALALAEAGDCPSDLALRLREKARRNERLLTAAARGVKAARQRAKDLAEAGRFQTYGADGRRDMLGVAAQAPARRL